MNESTRISVEQRPSGVKVITVTGDLDSMGTHMVEDSFSGAITDRASRVVINLGPVNFISSAGLAMLLVKGKALRQGGGSMVLAEANPRVFEVLSLAGFNELFNIYPTVADALSQAEGR